MKYPESAARLKELRERVGRTQAEVAEELDIYQSAVCRWELGETRPTRKYHERLAQLYNVPASELLQVSNPE